MCLLVVQRLHLHCVADVVGVLGIARHSSKHCACWGPTCRWKGGLKLWTGLQWEMVGEMVGDVGVEDKG